MNKKAFARLLCLSAAALLPSCSSSGDKIGSTVKGERIAVMEAAKPAKADANLGAKPSLPPQIVNFSWPQAGYDGSHAMPYAKASAHPHVLWKSSIGEGSSSDYKILARPVGDRGTIYTMDALGHVRAFHAASGDRLWEIDTSPDDADTTAMGGGLAVDGGALYATTGFGDVVAMDSKTGARKWTKSLLKPLRAAPTVADGKIFVIGIDNDLDVLDAATGDALWHKTGISENATLMGAASPAVQGDTVIVPYSTGDLYGLRVQNGRVSWSYSLAGSTQSGALPAIADIRGLPVIDKGKVYAISHSGRMAAIDQRTGERVWEVDTGGIDTPVAAGDAVFVYGGEHQLMAFARDNGRIFWTVSLPRYEDPADKDSDPLVWTGPIFAGESLWMVNSKGDLASFSPTDGAALDIVELDHPLYVSPIVVDQTLYVATDDGTLIALR